MAKNEIRSPSGWTILYSRLSGIWTLTLGMKVAVLLIVYRNYNMSDDSGDTVIASFHDAVKTKWQKRSTFSYSIEIFKSKAYRSLNLLEDYKCMGMKFALPIIRTRAYYWANRISFYVQLMTVKRIMKKFQFTFLSVEKLMAGKLKLTLTISLCNPWN